MTQDNSKTVILNVDDFEAGRYATTRVLASAGYTVIEAATGAETLRKVDEEHPDLVLLDINLPDIDGFEVCRRIKADRRTTTLPVLHLSATYTDTLATVKGLEGGADSYLSQPVEPLVLLATVKALLRLKSAEALAVAEAAQWNMTFDAIRDAICLMDAEGRILRFNSAFAELAGRGQDEIAGRHCFDLVHGTTTFVEGCPFVRAMNSGHRESLDAELKGRWFHISVDPVLDRSGKIASCVHVMSDITGRKRSEEEIVIRNRIAQIFLAPATDEETYGEVLRVVLDIMESRYGVVGYLDEEGALVVPTMSRHVWDDCAVAEKTIVFRRETWGRARGPARSGRSGATTRTRGPASPRRDTSPSTATSTCRSSFAGRPSGCSRWRTGTATTRKRTSSCWS